MTPHRARELWPPARGLDAVAAEVAREWAVPLGPRFPMARFSFAAPAGPDAVLKIVPIEDDEADLEADALAAWAGDGAVRLLRHDRTRRALRIERCVPRTVDRGSRSRIGSAGGGVIMLGLHPSSAFAFGLAIIVSSCGGAAAPSPAASVATSAAPKPQDAVGFVSTKLADGPLDVLPTLPLFINVLDVPQPPASPIQHAHIAGFVYAVTGVHQLTIQTSAAQDVKPGAAAFVPGNVAHTHANPGTTASEWYFMGLRNTGARTGTPLFPGQTTLYETPDLPVTTFAPGKYVEQLNIITLEKGGRTASHKHGGVEVLVVLDGTLSLRVAGQAQTLTKGKGAFVLPNTALQATNTGDGQAKFLAYFVTLESAPFSTNVDTLP